MQRRGYKNQIMAKTVRSQTHKLMERTQTSTTLAC